jgi:hypothetical protein
MCVKATLDGIHFGAGVAHEAADDVLGRESLKLR